MATEGQVDRNMQSSRDKSIFAAGLGFLLAALLAPGAAVRAAQLPASGAIAASRQLERFALRFGSPDALTTLRVWQYVSASSFPAAQKQQMDSYFRQLLASQLAFTIAADRDRVFAYEGQNVVLREDSKAKYAQIVHDFRRFLELGNLPADQIAGQLANFAKDESMSLPGDGGLSTDQASEMLAVQEAINHILPPGSSPAGLGPTPFHPWTVGQAEALKLMAAMGGDISLLQNYLAFAQESQIEQALVHVWVPLEDQPESDYWGANWAGLEPGPQIENDIYIAYLHNVKDIAQTLVTDYRQSGGNLTSPALQAFVKLVNFAATRNEDTGAAGSQSAIEVLKSGDMPQVQNAIVFDLRTTVKDMQLLAQP